MTILTLLKKIYSKINEIYAGIYNM